MRRGLKIIHCLVNQKALLPREMWRLNLRKIITLKCHSNSWTSKAALQWRWLVKQVKKILIEEVTVAAMQTLQSHFQLLDSNTLSHQGLPTLKMLFIKSKSQTQLQIQCSKDNQALKRQYLLNDWVIKIRKLNQVTNADRQSWLIALCYLEASLNKSRTWTVLGAMGYLRKGWETRS
jgi:hypothetical protein